MRVCVSLFLCARPCTEEALLTKIVCSLNAAAAQPPTITTHQSSHRGVQRGQNRERDARATRCVERIRVGKAPHPSHTTPPAPHHLHHHPQWLPPITSQAPRHPACSPGSVTILHLLGSPPTRAPSMKGTHHQASLPMARTVWGTTTHNAARPPPPLVLPPLSSS